MPQHHSEEMKMLNFLFLQLGIGPITYCLNSHTLLPLRHDSLNNYRNKLFSKNIFLFCIYSAFFTLNYGNRVISYLPKYVLYKIMLCKFVLIYFFSTECVELFSSLTLTRALPWSKQSNRKLMRLELHLKMKELINLYVTDLECPDSKKKYNNLNKSFCGRKMQLYKNNLFIYLFICLFRSLVMIRLDLYSKCIFLALLISYLFFL